MRNNSSISRTGEKFFTAALIILVLLFDQCEKEVPSQNLNEPYFTIVDTAFYIALISQRVDKNLDGKISYKEAEAVKSLYLGGETPDGRSCTSSTGISDYTGIEAFINLESLNCLCGDAATLDLSENTHLNFLDCSLNKLTQLNVSDCPELTELWCTTNYLNNLDVSQNAALKILGCVNNGIADLDLSGNPDLTRLSCGLNHLTTLDVSSLTSLTSLYCSENDLTELDLSNNIVLIYLNFRDNALTSLDISHNTSLQSFIGNRNDLTSLDISGNTMLTSILLKEMPSLYEVFVWELPFPPDEVMVDTTGSPNIIFTK